ncbi:hypothetical protein LZK98_17475 [Sphingomonas cannabina]|uniref:DUF6961 family protein n=1 Tax=Sphingomonas cannabina TaxID=2899123 RepID=UPI001F28EB9C|nr:hypothetical protein [Sphingomonas cannabina]UIJ44824.1 hypothetical protein LZK98_17475 [Sphingomonas cannabina]
MTRDEQLWGAALAIERQHAGRAPAYVAERIAAAARAGDPLGIETMTAIAIRLDQLLSEVGERPAQ